MVIKIKGFRISDNIYFSISMLLFCVYCFIPKVRSLSLYGVQIPIIIISYVFLFLAINRRRGQNSAISMFILSLLIVVFNYIFLQSHSYSVFSSTGIGIGLSLFIVFFPLLYVYSREIEFTDYNSLYDIIMILVCITCVTTIIGSFQYSSPSRQVSGNANAALNALYTSRNIGGYRFVYFLLLCIPYMVKRLQLRKSIFDLLVLVLSSFCIIRSDFTTAIILWLIILVLSFAMKKSKIVTLLFVAIAAVILFSYLDDFLVLIAGKSSSYMLNNRINTLLLYMQGGASEGDLLIRQDLYSNSLQAFLHNPIFGEFFYSGDKSAGGHSQILDFLANAGLVGAVILVGIIVRISKWPSIKFIETDKFRKLQLTLSIIIATINTFLSPELFFAILIIPMLNNADSINMFSEKKR